ncbi:hypothetical protein [Hymenobacter siberiensis]|nr:hypothetical protein [Hymenobacter siberiensis]
MSEAPTPRSRRWVWWLLGAAIVLLGITLVVQQLLDPWLRRKLEQ